VIAQHIPKAFSGPFAKRMNDSCDLNVCEASDRQPILAGHAYIAPGDQHLLVIRDGAHYRCQLSDGPLVNRHRPSVDVLFRSVAQNVAHNAVGVMLTGMGRDGAEGMREMRDAGAINFVQDEPTSVVWGMAGAAWELAAAEAMVPLEGIARKVSEAVQSRNITRTAAARK
jgi:two-component system chemotaxis response regulator CheB